MLLPRPAAKAAAGRQWVRRCFSGAASHHLHGKWLFMGSTVVREWQLAVLQAPWT